MSAVGNYEVVSATHSTGSQMGKSVVYSLPAPEGKRVLGGSIVGPLRASASSGYIAFRGAYPAPDGSAWNVLLDIAGGDAEFTLYATCAEMGC